MARKVSLGATETAFVATCAKYYKPGFLARLQQAISENDGGLQHCFEETLKAFGFKNVLPEDETASFGFVYPTNKAVEKPKQKELEVIDEKPEAEKPEVEKPKVVEEKPVSKPVVKNKAKAAKKVKK